jgi:hypothetical protein
LRWYLEARAQQIGGQFEFHNGSSSATDK